MFVSAIVVDIAVALSIVSNLAEAETSVVGVAVALSGTLNGFLACHKGNSLKFKYLMHHSYQHQ